MVKIVKFAIILKEAVFFSPIFLSFNSLKLTNRKHKMFDSKFVPRYFSSLKWKVYFFYNFTKLQALNSCLCIFTQQTYFAFDSRAETEVYLRYGQHPELYPNRRGEIVQGLVYGKLFLFLFFHSEAAKKINGTCREWLILFSLCYLFYLQLILRTRIPWLSFTDVLCAITRLSWAVPTRFEMPLSLTYATAIYQALLTKWTICSRWTKVC